MRKTALSVALVSLGVAATTALPASASHPRADASATKQVKIGDLFFKNKSLTIRSGDTVKWVWTGAADHNVVVTRGPRKFHSSTKARGSFTKTLRARGTYRYICTIHPDSMKGKIVVR